MHYPLYLTHDELTVVADALYKAAPNQEPQWDAAAESALEKTKTLLRLAEHSEAADEAEHAYCDMTRDVEVYELYTD